MIKDKKILAVVTARAGSKGLVGKNYKPFCNLPLFMWSVLAALESEYIDTVFVSTNCPFVKTITQQWKENTSEPEGDLHVVDRPPELCTDLSKNEEALIHSLQIYEDKFGESPDYIVNLQPTSPLRRNRLVDKCIETIYDHNCDSLLTVKASTPFFWKVTNGNPDPMYDVLNRPMRQELTPEQLFWFDDGNVYIMTTDTLLSRMCRIGTNPFLYENEPVQSYQIDTELDFSVLECVVSNSDGKVV